MEDSWAAAANTLKEYGVLLYARFMDDGLFLVDAPFSKRHEYFQMLTQTVWPFKVAVFSWSSRRR